MMKAESLNKKFWDAFLENVRKCTDFYKNTQSGGKSYIKTNLGIGGVAFSTCIRADDGVAWVELCFQKEDADDNRKLFNEYFCEKEEIENRFGDELEWVDYKDVNDKKDIKRRRIKCKNIIFDAKDSSTWKETHQNLAENMAKLKNSLKEYGILKSIKIL
ncbi:DUF4268 domain-containing protein [Desulfopila sp. IMCC35006]|uniref:DUF4268 domain-containing protein n=1 Tax=Desulfopila sp. IMCC35006 TaxID=2569542 RepID=UPI0010AD4B75|nr:DUF4268 domain-containing protein [Desulfopila sp. IMCC35006]TKB23184.1 DUF4268 domain-containing protein [Desulfopila sp. IMCC35006]